MRNREDLALRLVLRREDPSILERLNGLVDRVHAVGLGPGDVEDDDPLELVRMSEISELPSSEDDSVVESHAVVGEKGLASVSGVVKPDNLSGVRICENNLEQVLLPGAKNGGLHARLESCGVETAPLQGRDLPEVRHVTRNHLHVLGVLHELLQTPRLQSGDAIRQIGALARSGDVAMLLEIPLLPAILGGLDRSPASSFPVGGAMDALHRRQTLLGLHHDESLQMQPPGGLGNLLPVNQVHHRSGIPHDGAGVLLGTGGGVDGEAPAGTLVCWHASLLGVVFGSRKRFPLFIPM